MYYVFCFFLFDFWLLYMHFKKKIPTQNIRKHARIHANEMKSRSRQCRHCYNVLISNVGRLITETEVHNLHFALHFNKHEKCRWLLSNTHAPIYTISVYKYRSRIHKIYIVPSEILDNHIHITHTMSLFFAVEHQTVCWFVFEWATVSFSQPSTSLSTSIKEKRRKNWHAKNNPFQYINICYTHVS